MPGTYTFYDGSQVLKPIEEYTGLEVDKINYVLCLISAMPIAYYYQVFLPPDKVSRKTRLAFPLIVGLSFYFFCFGRAMKHLLANALISYLVLSYSPPKYVHLTVFVFSMSYLLWIHFYRWMILTSWSLDVTGPMMVAVQKITTLAFSLHDGLARKQEHLTPRQRKEAIKEIPPLLDYLSYIFNFQTGMTGPVNYYADYSAFIDGANHNECGVSNVRASLKKLAQAVFFMIVIVLFAGHWPPEIIATKYYLEMNWFSWLFFWYISILFVRCNYYFAWLFADAICNMSGFGFSGKNANGEAQWDLCKNVDPLKVENGENLKEVLDNWNIQTAGWLRRVAYERTPKKIRTIATYLLSAVWHGVSVGYYMTFITGAMFTPAAATFRRCMRWRFLNDPVKKRYYDIFSNISTKVALAYATYPFVTMNLHPAIDVYWRVFFIGHLVCLAILFKLPQYYPPNPEKGLKKISSDADLKSTDTARQTAAKESSSAANLKTTVGSEKEGKSL